MISFGESKNVYYNYTSVEDISIVTYYQIIRKDMSAETEA